MASFLDYLVIAGGRCTTSLFSILAGNSSLLSMTQGSLDTSGVNHDRDHHCPLGGRATEAGAQGCAGHYRQSSKTRASTGHDAELACHITCAYKAACAMAAPQRSQTSTCILYRFALAVGAHELWRHVCQHGID